MIPGVLLVLEIYPTYPNMRCQALRQCDHNNLARHLEYAAAFLCHLLGCVWIYKDLTILVFKSFVAVDDAA